MAIAVSPGIQIAQAASVTTEQHAYRSVLGRLFTKREGPRLIAVFAIDFAMTRGLSWIAYHDHVSQRTWRQRTGRSSRKAEFAGRQYVRLQPLSRDVRRFGQVASWLKAVRYRFQEEARRLPLSANPRPQALHIGRKFGCFGHYQRVKRRTFFVDSPH